MVNTSANELPTTKRSTVKRAKARASYRREDVYRLVDDVKLAHIGFIEDGHVVMIPITLWRVEDALYLHVINKSRLQRLLEAGGEVCVSVAECSEWVLAKSAFHHSANYRSAVLYCSGERVTDEQQFDQAFAVIVDQVEEGRWQQVRPPNKKERKATALMKLTIKEGSFKSRSGGPNEEPEDMALPVWHGQVPVCPYHPAS